MEVEIMFRILGIDSTKDEAAIRTAYLKKLAHTNPEDDTEGFKRLRQAYEEALGFAGRREVIEDEAEKTPVQLWIDRVSRLYEDMEGRHSKKRWEQLLLDPVCEELDTADEARESLLVFFMDHIHLPHDIWKLIDKKFTLVSDYDQLKERFPGNFLDYVAYFVENEGFLPFELFRVTDITEENGDGYLDHYFALKRKLDKGETDNCFEELKDLRAFGLYHPYEDVERTRLFLLKGDKEKAALLGEELLEKYPDDCYIRVYAAYALWDKGERERAYGLWKEVLEERPQYYQARMGVVRYLTETGNNYDAREILLEILEEDSRDEKSLALLRETNNRLIGEFKDKLLKGEAHERLPGREMELELGWCMFQNEQIDEAVKVLSGFVPGPREEYGFNNLYGRLLYRAGQYEQALPYLKKWLRLIEETRDDNTEENRKRLSRKGRASYILGGCYFELGKQAEAEAAVRKAASASVSKSERLGCLQYLSHILFQAEKYERSVDVCDEILNEDSSYYPAYLMRQEACYELKKGQEVVDDYHRAIALFPGYYKPYLLAAKVFYYHSQFEDARGVLQRAEENEVEFSDAMKLYQVRILRNLAQNEEDRKKTLEILLRLGKELKEETDLEDVSELEFEATLLYWEGEHFETALTHLSNALEQNENRLQYYMVKGHICLDLKRYDEALYAYDKAEPVYGDLAAIHYNKGLCYEGKGLRKLAAECYEKTLKLEKTYRDACEKLADYYQEQYKDKCRREDLKKAVRFMDRQVEATENCYYLVHRGLIYMNALELEPAMEDFEKALQNSPEDWAAYNNLGCCYKYLGRYEEAMKAFLKSLECLKERRSPLPYSNLADCYEAMGQYREAINCYEEDLKRFPEKTSFYKEIGVLWGYLKEYQKAFAALLRIEGEPDYYKSAGDLWRRKGNILKTVLLYTGGVRNSPEKAVAERLYELGLLYTEIWPAMAGICLKKAVRRSQSDRDTFRYERSLAVFYYLKKDYKRAKKHGEYALCHFKQGAMGTEEEFVAYKPYSPSRLADFAWLSICLGDKKKGEEYFERIFKSLRCITCRHKGCYGGYYYRGRYLEAEGRLEAALADYAEAARLNKACLTVELAYKKLRKRMGLKNDDRN